MFQKTKKNQIIFLINSPLATYSLLNTKFNELPNWQIITLWYYLTYDRIQFTIGSAFVYLCHFGARTILSHSHFEDDSSPHISGSSFLIQIKPIFVLFKHATLIWIDYLETWSRSDNTSCYYKIIITLPFRLPDVSK